MRQFYGSNDILVLPDDLRAFAWSSPMRDLASKLEMSDVGLKKLLATYGIAPPPQGYWNMVQAGKPVPNCPKSPPRRPGGTGRIRVDGRFSTLLTPASSISSLGPFATQLVPENLEELQKQELRAIGRATVPKKLDGAHRGLVQLLKKKRRRREKLVGRDWHWDSPKFDTPLGQRQLRILNGVFLALSKRGHDGDASERDGEIHARAIVGDTYMGLEISAAGKCRTLRQSGYLRPAPDLPAKTPLALRIRPDFDNALGESWQDDMSGQIEDKVASIAAGIIVAGEAKFRRSLRESEERAERERIQHDERQKEMVAERNRQRLQSLRASGELLRQAQEIRSLVESVRHAIRLGSVPVDSQTQQSWEHWALSEADRIDPVLSGQVLTHLREPS